MPLRYRNNLTDCPVFFVTTTVVNHLPVFKYETACNILVKNIRYYQEKYRYVILGYVIMPSHFHWIVKVEKNYGTISDIMRDIKKYSAWQIMNYAEKENLSYKIIFEKASEKYYDQERKFWMKRFDDQVIRSQRMFMTKLKYIHNNPVKAKLSEKITDYKFSSARNYILNDHSVLYVDVDYAGLEMVY